MMDGPHYGAPPGMGYDGMRGYGHKDRGFFSRLFGNRNPRHDMVGAVPMEMNFGHEWNPMPRDYGLQDFAPRGYGFEMPRRRDFSPGRAWMAHRARDFDDFDDVDLEMPRRRDHLMDDLDLMVSRRDPLRDIPRRDPIDMMLERNEPSPPPLPPMRSEPAPRRDYRRPMSVGAQIDQDNANKGWVQGKDMRKGTFELPRIKSDVVQKPKYKFNSPEHQWHVKRNVDAREVQKQINAERNRREQEQEEKERRRKQEERERYDDRRGGRGDGGGGGRGRRGRGRRGDGGYSSEEYDDNDNPYHHLPAHHIPHDDYDNAVRRNLHAWSQWRSDMNDRRGRETRVIFCKLAGRTLNSHSSVNTFIMVVHQKIFLVVLWTENSD